MTNHGVSSSADILKAVREYDEKHKKKQAASYLRVGHMLRCDQTGDVYPSIKAAARALGIHHTNITRHMKGERKSVAGYTFTQVEAETNDHG